MANERISIKGTSNGLIVNLGAGVWQGLLTELDQTLTDKASFFKGGRVAVRVGPRQLTRPQIEAIGQILDLHGVTLWAIESNAAGTQEATQQLGLETVINPAQATPEVAPASTTAVGPPRPCGPARSFATCRRPNCFRPSGSWRRGWRPRCRSRRTPPRPDEPRTGAWSSSSRADRGRTTGRTPARSSLRLQDA